MAKQISQSAPKAHFPRRPPGLRAMVMALMLGGARTTMETPPEMFSTAPDVSPDDIWQDAACLAPEGQVILPPKRLKEGKPGGFANAADDEGGLRIGTRSFSHSPAETFAKLEVQEIHGDVVRLHPEEPEAERMPRHAVFHEKPDSPAALDEVREWGGSKTQPLRWILGTGMAVAAVVVGAVLALPSINKPNTTRPGSGEADWVVETVTNSDAMADVLSRKAEAGRVLRTFLTAPSVEAILPLARDPGEVAELIQANRRMPELSPNSPPLMIDSWTARENQSLTYGILSGALPDYSKFETYFTISGGRLVMDWKASTGYGTADFSQLRQKQGNPAEIRGWIEAAEFYAVAFSENSHQSYILASPDKQQVIWAYVQRGSGIHQKLKALIKGGYILEGRKEAHKVTVRLEPGPGDSPPSHWEIVELLHKEWIAP